MGGTATPEANRLAGFGGRLSLGSRPAILVVDFSYGFTDPASPLGSDFSREVEATAQLLDVARAHDVPAIFTTIAYEQDSEAGIWAQKVPTVTELRVGAKWVEIDSRLRRRPDEPVVVKKGASAFFGTNLAATLVTLRIDTVVLCGASTSGCIRATAVDLLQYGWPTLIPRECVADRATAAQEANLIDIASKYGEVGSLADALTYIASPGPSFPVPSG